MQPLPAEAGVHEQDRVGARRARLIEVRLRLDEILAEDREARRVRDLFKKRKRAVKLLFLRDDGQHRSPCRFQGKGHLRHVAAAREIPVLRGITLDVRDEGDAARCCCFS